MPRNQLLELKAKFYKPTSSASNHLCTPFEEFVETTENLSRYESTKEENVTTPQIEFFFYAAVQDTYENTDQDSKTYRSFALQLWRGNLHNTTARSSSKSDKYQKHVIFSSKPVPLTATLLNQTVVLRYLYQQLLERQRLHSSATTSSGSESAVPQHLLHLASTVDETGAVRRIDLYRDSPDRFVALIALGGQHGAPHRRVAELVAGVLTVFSQSQMQRGCEPTELCGWPQAPSDLTIYDLCKTIKMVRQFGLLGAVFPLELLLVRALTALFGESSDDFHRRRRAGVTDCQVHRLRTSSVVFLASTAVLESLPYLWRFAEAHDAVLRMAQQEEKISERDQSTVGADEQAMLRTLQCTRTLLERYGVPTRKTNLSAIIDRSQYFWPVTTVSSADQTSSLNAKNGNGKELKTAKDKQNETSGSVSHGIETNLASVQTDLSTCTQSSPNAVKQYRWTVPPCLRSVGSTVTCALCRSTFARIILASLVESSGGVERKVVRGGGGGGYNTESQQRAIDLYVFTETGASLPNTDYNALLPSATMHVRITLPQGSLDLLKLDEEDDEQASEEQRQSSRSPSDQLPWKKPKVRTQPPKVTIERLNSIQGFGATAKVEFPLTSLYEWLQIVLWSHSHVCFDVFQVAESAIEFYKTNSSQHPYVLIDSNEQRLRSLESHNQLRNRSAADQNSDGASPQYSMVPFDNAEFSTDTTLSTAGSLVWYSQFSYVMRQYALRIVQNVNIPDSCNF